MEINLLSGALGAEISGINLKDTSKENFKKINNLLLEHKVIFFRNQKISSEEQISLASCFGALERHAYVKGIKEHPKILRIIKEPNEKNQWGEGWHSDVSYNKTPSKAVILKSVEIPSVGGDTVFSNMELAWDTLDVKIKNIIRDKNAVHSSLGASYFVDNYQSMKSNGNFDEYSNEHPIVRTHPETGKKILFVNWTYTKEIIGINKNESKELLREIFKHQERLDLTCRFRWSENAVAIWDNRSVQHYAIADFYPGKGLECRRVMDRIAIVGDKPN